MVKARKYYNPIEHPYHMHESDPSSAPLRSPTERVPLAPPPRSALTWL